MKLFLLSGLAIIGLSTSITPQINQSYTIQQAQQCFHSKALVSCENIINECLMREQCEKQLQFFDDCNFEKQFDNQVFNGNCFKNWKSFAKDSKQVIDCLDSQCNLAQYNSDVSLSVLYSCSTEALFNINDECDEQCLQRLSKIVSQRVPYTPLREIYELSQEQKSNLNNQSAQQIIEVIQKQCVDENGEIRKRHEKELLDKKINKRKMQDRMNKIPKRESSHDESNQVQQNKQTLNDL